MLLLTATRVLILILLLLHGRGRTHLRLLRSGGRYTLRWSLMLLLGLTLLLGRLCLLKRLLLCERLLLLLHRLLLEVLSLLWSNVCGPSGMVRNRCVPVTNHIIASISMTRALAGFVQQDEGTLTSRLAPGSSLLEDS